MTLPENVNEDLARLRGWEADGRKWWRWITKQGSGGPYDEHQVCDDCPDMTTPDAMVDLLEFCWKRGLHYSLDSYLRPGKIHCYVFSLEDEEVAGDCEADTLPEAVALAVHAVMKYLTEKEQHNGKDT